MVIIGGKRGVYQNLELKIKILNIQNLEKSKS
jgi:hypothetical protein